LRTYETVVVIDSLLKNEEIDEIVNKVERVINNNGGKIVSIERWGKKRLAYEIKRRQYGYYVEIVFEAPSNVIRVLEREYQLEENILRYLSIHLGKKALEYREKQSFGQKDSDSEKSDSENKIEKADEISTEDVNEELSDSEIESNPVVEPSIETIDLEK